MYSYTWDSETGGLLLNSTQAQLSKEPRPVYYQELDILGFDKYFAYEKDDSAPYMWAEANNYIYRGRLVAQIKGGTVFSTPSIDIIAAPTDDNAPLKQVNIKGMIQANQERLDVLEKYSIQRVYNTFVKYSKKVDIFHVSYSGGKDSEVAFDIVQRAIPHNAFVAIFGNTGMEYPDTYQAIELFRKRCELLGVRFYIAQSHMKPQDSWLLFGPPASNIRWCCSVHKTTPQLLKLREILDVSHFTEMAFVGVRRDESYLRNSYDFISYETKHKGQYSCNPILDWSSAEVFLYIYAHNLHLNEAYKKGLSRVGCLVCPMSSQRSLNMRLKCYREPTLHYFKLITELNSADKGNTKRLTSYIENMGWKSRSNGRDLSIAKKDYYESFEKNNLQIVFKDTNYQWKEWIKTVGRVIDNSESECTIDFKGVEYKLAIARFEDGHIRVELCNVITKDALEFSKRIRRAFRKSHYCVACKVCEANCKFGNISFNQDKTMHISDSCTHCGLCLEVDTGCLVYKSILLPNGLGNMKKSLDRYGTHAPKLDWFVQWIKYGAEFKSSHSLGNNEVPIFRKFLKDSELAENEKDLALGSVFRKDGIDSESVWALMLINLSYTVLVGWWVKEFDFQTFISQKFLIEKLANTDGVSSSGAKRIPNDIKRLALLPIGKLGFGVVSSADRQNGFTITRQPWQNPDPRVILYSLYKFAEACGGYYQFTLTRLMDDSIDSDGVTPSQIFGLDRPTLEGIVKGLAINHSDYISVAFTLDLDNINLQSDKTAADVLTLF